MKRKLAVVAVLLAAITRTEAQNQKYLTPAQRLMITNEDSLNNGVARNKTVISGYGSAFYQRNFNEKQSTITLERAVLFVGHQFNEKIAFFSELELENAKVTAGESGTGEISMEQAYLKFNLN